MHIVSAASEAVPYCKTGGLADVTGALARELGQRGHRSELFLPYYRRVRLSAPPASEALRFSVQVAGRYAAVRLLRAEAGPATAYFVDCPEYFDRDELYQERGRDYPDNAERFALFCRAVVEGVKLLGHAPDVFHCHDWHTGLIPAYLKTLYAADPFYRGCGSLFTIHNLAYQGLFPKEAMGIAGLPLSEFAPEKLEFHGKVGYLKSGLVHGDLLSTVSPTYAREIQSTPELGMGLEGLLRWRGEQLFGVLNGLDTRSWDPSTDPSLPARYGPGDFAVGKASCRKALRAECGFPAEGGAMLIGAVSRLDRQKGLDLALSILPAWLEKGAQFVLVGRGDPALESEFAAFSRRHPRSVHYHVSFDDPFARRVYAACDLFLMPSRFEPCGLGQMIAMRYGALPLGTRTGGLADTIVEEGPRANGFLAAKASASEVSAAFARAWEAHSDEAAWTRRIQNAMAADFDWGRSVESYLELYRKASSRRASVRA